MRSKSLVFLLLAIFPLMSCGDIDQTANQSGATEPIQVDGPHPRLLHESDDVRITTLPVDDIEEYVEEMPDGIHLRPGVAIHQLQELGLQDIEISRHHPIVRVSGAAIDAFAEVNPGDAVFLDEGYGFIVEGLTYEQGLITLEVSTFELTRVIWGNFKIEYKMPTVMTEDDIDQLTEPVIDEFGNVTRTQALSALRMKKEQGWEEDGWSASFEAEVNFPVRLEGVFEGRIGTFNSSYDCRINAQRSWYQRDERFCVDRLGAWINASIEAQGELSVTYRRGLRFHKGGPEHGRFFQRTLGRVPLGSTGLFLDLVAFAQYTLDAEAGGEVTMSYTYNYSATAPIGFEYRNYPETRFASTNGVRPIPNSTRPVQKRGENHTFDVDGSVSAEAGAKVEAGVFFQVSAAAGVARLEGPQLKAVFDAQAFYKPFARDDQGACAKLHIQLRGEAVARIEFKVDLKLWKWTTEFSCEQCTATFLPWDILGPWTSRDSPFCLSGPSYDKLVVEYASGGPEPYEAPEGYIIDAIEVRSVVPGVRIPRVQYAISGGGSGAHGRPNATSCPLTSGNVHPVTSRAEFGFSRPLKPGDTIKVIQTSVPAGGGLCSPGGRARFTLKGAGGTPDVQLTNGNFVEGGPTLTVPQ